MKRFLSCTTLVSILIAGLLPGIAFADQPSMCTIMVGNLNAGQTKAEINVGIPTITETSIAFASGLIKNIGPNPATILLRIRWTNTDVFDPQNSLPVYNGVVAQVGSTYQFSSNVILNNGTPNTGYKFQIYETESGNNCQPFVLNTAPTAQQQQNGTPPSTPGPLPVIQTPVTPTNPALSDGTPLAPITTIGDLTVNDENRGRGLVPCGQGQSATCGWNGLLELVNRVIDFTLVLLVPATAAIAVAAGVNMILSRGNPAKLDKAKKLLYRVLLGVGVVLISWVAIAAVYSAIIPADTLSRYVLLDIFN